jgi:hypothetical protein
VIVLLAVYALGTHARICGRGSSEWLKSTDALAAVVNAAIKALSDQYPCADHHAANRSDPAR